jgi:hypothetical protein
LAQRFYAALYDVLVDSKDFGAISALITAEVKVRP